MKIKKYICQGVPVEIRIEEDTLSHKEKLYIILELLKESIELEYTPIVIENKDKEKIAIYHRSDYVLKKMMNTLKEEIEMENLEKLNNQPKKQKRKRKK